MRIPVGDAGGGSITGDLVVPDDGERPAGIVVFAHGSGSSRRSPRNRMVAAHFASPLVRNASP